MRSALGVRHGQVAVRADERTKMTFILTVKSNQVPFSFKAAFALDNGVSDAHVFVLIRNGANEATGGANPVESSALKLVEGHSGTRYPSEAVVTL